MIRAISYRVVDFDKIITKACSRNLRKDFMYDKAELDVRNLVSLVLEKDSDLYKSLVNKESANGVYDLSAQIAISLNELPLVKDYGIQFEMVDLVGSLSSEKSRLGEMEIAVNEEVKRALKNTIDREDFEEEQYRKQTSRSNDYVFEQKEMLYKILMKIIENDEFMRMFSGTSGPVGGVSGNRQWLEPLIKRLIDGVLSEETTT